ncbi:putative zinc finger protein, partial [Orchesella cincta]
IWTIGGKDSSLLRSPSFALDLPRKNLETHWKQNLKRLEILETPRRDIVLDVNRQEREGSTFCRRCLFCHEVVTGGNRSDYFLHMWNCHSFHIGQPDNLVFVKEFFQLIEDKLNRLECLFCENIYKDELVLKEHMRKKQHRKINPHNSEYDRFYVVNYLEPGKTWEDIEMEDNTEDENREEEWTEVSEENQRNVVCLFCSERDAVFENVLDHMKTEHHFDFCGLLNRLVFMKRYELSKFGLQFKEGMIMLLISLQVKLVNYIRRAVYQLSCLSCDERFQDQGLLLAHVSEHNINGSVELLPTVEKWNQAEYFFPTYENDDFLTFLEDDDKINQTDDGAGGFDVESNVIPEDLPPMAKTNRDFDLAGFAMRYHNESDD